MTNAHQESLENHVRVQAAALDSFSEMNSSLTSASIDLQVHFNSCFTADNCLFSHGFKSIHKTWMTNIDSNTKQAYKVLSWISTAANLGN